MTQREQPRLALVTALPLAAGGLRLEAPGMPRLEVTRPPSPAGTGGPAAPTPTPTTSGTGSETGQRAATALVPVRIWGDEVEAVPADDTARTWFSRYLGADTRLVHLDDPARRRPIDPPYGAPGETVTFADGFPLLLTTTASLTALSDLITEDALSSGAVEVPEPLTMNRFRPSVVVGGTAPWAEDGWHRIRLGEVSFRVAKPCGRCVVTTTDQDTAERGPEPLRTLGRHRRFGKELVFGQNLVPEHTGVLRVGDPLTVLA